MPELLDKWPSNVVAAFDNAEMAICLLRECALWSITQRLVMQRCDSYNTAPCISLAGTLLAKRNSCLRTMFEDQSVRFAVDIMRGIHLGRDITESAHHATVRLLPSKTCWLDL